MRSYESVSNHAWGPILYEITRIDSNVYKAIRQICCLSTPNCINVLLTTAVLSCKKMFLCVLILKKLFYSVRLLYKTSIGLLLATRSGRSNSNAKNNDLSRFTKYSIFTADLFYIYLPIKARTSAKYRNNLGEPLVQTPETYLRQVSTARGSKHMYIGLVYNHDIVLFQ